MACADHKPFHGAQQFISGLQAIFEFVTQWNHDLQNLRDNTEQNVDENPLASLLCQASETRLGPKIAPANSKEKLFNGFLDHIASSRYITEHLEEWMQAVP